MKNTSSYKKQVQALRNEMLADLCQAVQATKKGMLRFTDTQAPRMYFDGGWREIVVIKLGFFESANGLLFGWHDERCGSNSANAFVGAASLCTETLLQCHELVYGEGK